jgi:hypothetical protein
VRVRRSAPSSSFGDAEEVTGVMAHLKDRLARIALSLAALAGLAIALSAGVKWK